MWTSTQPLANLKGVLALTFFTARSSKKDHTSDAESTSEATATPTSHSPTASNPTDDMATGDTATSGLSETGSTPEINREICERYLACVAAVSPGSLPMAQQGFGEDGTCWQGSEAEMQQCIEACKAGLDQFHMASPDEPKCALCQDAGDCSGDEACVGGECISASCGDAVVDAGEVCDDAKFCDGDCGGPAKCSPITGAGCTGDNVCVFVGDTPSCMPNNGLLQAGEACDTGTCTESLACLDFQTCNTENHIPCCVLLCNNSAITDPCPPGQSCASFPFGVIPGFSPPAELAEYIGLCL